MSEGHAKTSQRANRPGSIRAVKITKPQLSSTTSIFEFPWMSGGDNIPESSRQRQPTCRRCHPGTPPVFGRFRLYVRGREGEFGITVDFMRLYGMESNASKHGKDLPTIVEKACDGKVDPSEYLAYT